MRWNFLSIPKLQRLHRWNLGEWTNNFTQHFAIDIIQSSKLAASPKSEASEIITNYWSMLWFKSTHVSKRDPRPQVVKKTAIYNLTFDLIFISARPLNPAVSMTRGSASRAISPSGNIVFWRTFCGICDSVCVSSFHKSTERSNWTPAE